MRLAIYPAIEPSFVASEAQTRPSKTYRQKSTGMTSDSGIILNFWSGVVCSYIDVRSPRPLKPSDFPE